MSNPGVITLARLRNAGENISRLDIEDNIGESIHIHLNNLRLDLGVMEFLAFAEEIEQSASSLDVFKKFDLHELDPNFLYEIRSFLKDLISVEIKQVRLRQLRCLVRTSIPRIGHVFLPRSIDKTPAYRYLTKASNDFIVYKQDNYPTVDNMSRLMQLNYSINNTGYPRKRQYIVLFGDQNYIRDGQHRAAILANMEGLDRKIDVLIMRFSGRRWRMNPYQQAIKIIFMKIVKKLFQKSKYIMHCLGLRRQ